MLSQAIWWIRVALPGKLRVFRLDVMDMSAFRSVVSAAAGVLLGVTAVSPIVACGKKGPLYLPDAKPAVSALAEAVSAPANYLVQEQR
jgi:predicted small lipoprotein YifL